MQVPSHGIVCLICPGVHNRSIVFVSQDSDNFEITRLIDEAAAHLPIVHLHHVRPFYGLLSLFISTCLPARAWRTDYATASNVHSLLSFGFDTLESEAIILLESDLEPSYDFYTFFRWANHHILQPPLLRDRIWNINGFTRAHKGSGDMAMYELYADRFMVWGWCTSRHVWPLIRDGWTWFDNWDWAMQAAREAHGRLSLSPAISRIRNVGMMGINFNIAEDSEAAKRWLERPLPGRDATYRYSSVWPLISWEGEQPSAAWLPP